MIRLFDRNLSPAALTQLEKYQSEINAAHHYADRVAKAGSMWKPRNKTFNEITNTLIAMCPGDRRCCYCEDARGEDIEHFRPKHLYPELTFDWTNYLLACSACNSNAKRERFAVIDGSSVFHDVTRPRKSPIIPPISGDPVLINPRYENPLDFLRIDLLHTFYFRPRPGLSAVEHQRAEYTIDVLKLNIRVELVDWRRKAHKVFVGWVDTYGRYKHTDPTRLPDHQTDLKSYNHLAVWEEMKRIYRERDSRWDRLKLRYPVIEELDELFTQFPEVLSI